MIFLVPASLVALLGIGCLIVGWEINRPDTGRRAKPLSIEDQRTLRWARSLNRKNVSRPGYAVPPPASPAGPGHHHAHGAVGPATPPRGTCGQPEAGTNGGGPVRSDVSRPGHGAAGEPPTGLGTPSETAGPGHSEACEPCTVNQCGPGCRCSCHWGESPYARADAWYGAPEIDAALIARADAVLAGVA